MFLEPLPEPRHLGVLETSTEPSLAELDPPQKFLRVMQLESRLVYGLYLFILILMPRPSPWTNIFCPHKDFCPSLKSTYVFAWEMDGK